MSLTPLQLEVFHRLRMDGPIEMRFLEEYFPTTSLVELHGALDTLAGEELAHNVRRRINTGHLVNVWVANPQGQKVKQHGRYKQPEVCA